MVKRIIEQLRQRYPGRWTYSHAQNSWMHEEGWNVEPRSAPAPRFDGDDDSFETQFYRTDTNERVYVFRKGIVMTAPIIKTQDVKRRKTAKKPSAPNKPFRPIVPSKTFKITEHHKVPYDGLLTLEFNSYEDYVENAHVKLTDLDGFVRAVKQFMLSHPSVTDVTVDLRNKTVPLEVEVANPDYVRELAAYKKRKQKYDVAMERYEKALVQYQAELEKWTEFTKQRELDRARKLIEEFERDTKKRDLELAKRSRDAREREVEERDKQ